MNPHITLGFPDQHGRGEPVIVHGPEVPVQKQVQMVMDAKAKWKPIKGVAFLAVCPIGNSTIRASQPLPATAAYSEPATPANEPVKHGPKGKA